jgi:hypothetical protein
MFLTKQQILEHKFGMPGESMHEQLEDLFRPGTNLIRFSYEGCAQSPVLAASRMLTGETLSEDVVGHVAHKDAQAWVKVGSRKDNLNILMTHSMHTREEDGSYGTRSYTVASPLKGIKIPQIEFCHHFSKKWSTIDLSVFPVWPLLTEVSDLEVLSEGLTLRAKLIHEKNVIDKEKKRLQDMFTRQRKAGKIDTCIGPDGIVSYIPPQGTTKALVDEQGERVSTIPVEPSQGIELIPISKEFEFSLEKLPLEKLPWLYRESARLRQEIEGLNQVIRPFELGIIEANLHHDEIWGIVCDKEVMVGHELFEVNRYSIAEYDLPPQTKDKLESGEWKYIDVPKSRGENVLKDRADESSASEKDNS